MEAGEPLAESLARDRRRPLKPDAGNAAVGSEELVFRAMRFRAWLFVLNRTEKGIWKPENQDQKSVSFFIMASWLPNQPLL